MSFYYSDRMAGRSRMDYLAATYGRMGEGYQNQNARIG